MNIKRIILLILIIVFSLLAIETALGGYYISGYVNVTGNTSVVPGALVNNGSNLTYANATGFYNLTNMSNSTWNLSYTQRGYATGYKLVTVNGDNLTNQNISLDTANVPTNPFVAIGIAGGSAILIAIYTLRRRK